MNSKLKPKVCQINQKKTCFLQNMLFDGLASVKENKNIQIHALPEQQKRSQTSSKKPKP